MLLEALHGGGGEKAPGEAEGSDEFVELVACVRVSSTSATFRSPLEGGTSAEPSPLTFRNALSYPFTPDLNLDVPIHVLV